MSEVIYHTCSHCGNADRVPVPEKMENEYIEILKSVLANSAELVCVGCTGVGFPRPKGMGVYCDYCFDKIPSVEIPPRVDSIKIKMRKTK